MRRRIVGGIKVSNRRAQRESDQGYKAPPQRNESRQELQTSSSPSKIALLLSDTKISCTALNRPNESRTPPSWPQEGSIYKETDL
ncbi:unnamed protein product [Leptosia nina]|uniref:Uncharacterized protein n=1 Tax=Leptosia nina TaxID=320188 RepID=A0AAV1JPR5_9NEOP